MSQKNIGEYRESQHLTSVSVQTGEGGDFIAHEVFPTVPVDSALGTYTKFNERDLMSTEGVAPRTLEGDAQTVDFGTSKESYKAVEYALQTKITDEEREDKNNLVQQEAKTRFLVNRVLRKREVDFHSVFGVTSAWLSANNHDATSARWSSDTVNPITRVQDQAQTIHGNSGMMPNIGVVSMDVFKRLKQHPLIINRLGQYHEDTRLVYLKSLASLFELEDLYVSAAQRITSNEGASSTTRSYIFNNSMFLAYRTKTPAKEDPNAGYIFSYKVRDKNNKPGAPTVYTWRDESKERDFFRARGYYAMKVVNPNAGGLLYNLLA